MNLREHTVYLRVSTQLDLLGTGVITAIVDSVEKLTDVPFVASRDMGAHRRRPGAPQIGRRALEDLVGRGVHIEGRVRLSSCDDLDLIDATQVLGITAGAHPYSGAYVTSLDLRVPSARFDDERFVERFVAWVRDDLTPRAEPYQGHAHDTDDTAMQNVSLVAILQRGFGVEVDDPASWDVASNPGVEVSRGEFRYVATWLSIVGPHLRHDLGEDRVRALPHDDDVGLVEQIEPDHTFVRLTTSPQPSEPLRQRQRRLRELLAFDQKAHSKAYNWGYWDRKSRQRGPK